MRQTNYTEALNYLDNINIEPPIYINRLGRCWDELILELDNLPLGVKQALVNRLIDNIKETNAKRAEQRTQSEEKK
jgi:hypothetical protein